MRAIQSDVVVTDTAARAFLTEGLRGRRLEQSGSSRTGDPRDRRGARSGVRRVAPRPRRAPRLAERSAHARGAVSALRPARRDAGDRPLVDDRLRRVGCAHRRAARELARRGDEARHDHPAGRVEGGRDLLGASPIGTGPFDEAFERLQHLADVCPEERHLIHDDLLNRNVLVEDDRIVALLDWGSSKYGDFLYDVASGANARACASWVSRQLAASSRNIAP